MKTRKIAESRSRLVLAHLVSCLAACRPGSQTEIPPTKKNPIFFKQLRRFPRHIMNTKVFLLSYMAYDRNPYDSCAFLYSQHIVYTVIFGRTNSLKTNFGLNNRTDSVCSQMTEIRLNIVVNFGFVYNEISDITVKIRRCRAMIHHVCRTFIVFRRTWKRWLTYCRTRERLRRSVLFCRQASRHGTTCRQESARIVPNCSRNLSPLHERIHYTTHYTLHTTHYTAHIEHHRRRTIHANFRSTAD